MTQRARERILARVRDSMARLITLLSWPPLSGLMQRLAVPNDNSDFYVSLAKGPARRPAECILVIVTLDKRNNMT